MTRTITWQGPPRPGPSIRLRSILVFSSIALMSSVATFTADVEAACTVNGTSGDNVLHGTSGNDVICGHGGNDTIYGHGGSDTIYGGTGNDRIYGGTGTDWIAGEDGTDWIAGEDETDKVYGGNGNDTIYGGNGNDLVKGEAGDDLVRGEAGDDQVYGDAGADRLYGDGNNDLVWGGDHNDNAYGGSGNDLLRGENGNDALLGESGTDTVIGHGGSDTCTGGSGYSDKVHDATCETRSEVERLSPDYNPNDTSCGPNDLTCLAFSGYKGASIGGYRACNGHNCVLYAAFRLTLRGVPVDKLPGGNAYEWNNRPGMLTVLSPSAPKAGDIAQWESSGGSTNDCGGTNCGHVAYIERVNYDSSGKLVSITVSESSWCTGGKVRTISVGSGWPTKLLRLG